MKYKNIPQCIRKGIFYALTSAFVFAGSGMVAQAAEEAPPAQDGQSTELETATTLEIEAEANELISLPSEPIESSEPEVSTEDYTTTTTVENTYVEETENAVATTTEIVTTQVTTEEGLTKNEETAQTTTVTEGNVTTITTTGEYNEDVSSTETSSVTTIVTDNEELADQIESTVKAQEITNTENKEINFISKEINYSTLDSGGILSGITKYAEEFAEVTGITNIQDLAFSVVTVNGETKVTYQVDGEDIDLDESLGDLKDILIDAAKPTMSTPETTYTTLNGVDLEGDAKDAADAIENINDIKFSITPTSETTSEVSYIDTNGEKQVIEGALADAIIAVAQVGEVQTLTENYKGTTEYEDAASAQSEINQKVSEGYINVHIIDGETTHTENYNDDTVYTDKTVAEQIAEALKLEENGGFTTTDITVIEGTASEMITDFDGFSITTKDEYDRISSLDTKEVDGETYFVEENEDGTTTLYKLKQTNETFTILAMTGSIATPWGGDQHQEGSYIIGARHCLKDNVESYEDYDIDLTTYENKMNDILAEEQTADNTLTWARECQPFYGENKIEINAGGTYYIDASQAGRIHLNTSDKVNVILYGSDQVTVPIVTTKADYQPNQTGNGRPDFGNITPDITFVTEAVNVELQCSNNVGNVLTTNSTVKLNSGNFSGTIICDTITGFAEGHVNVKGEKGYLVDSSTWSAGSEDTYMVSASKEVSNLVVVGEKVISEIEIESTTTSEGEASVDKTYTLKISRYEKESDKGNWEEVKVITEGDDDTDTDTDTDIDSDTDIDTDSDTDTDTDSDTDTDDDTDTDSDSDTDTDSDSDTDDDSDTDTDSDSDSDSDTDTDTDTDTDDDVPPPPPVVPPTPPIPPETPPTPPAPPTITIIDDQVPLAGVSQVLGVRRAPAGQVLGARRSPNTGDMNSLAGLITLFGSSTTTLGLWTLSKRKRKKV